jgi:hypothetical protein
MVLLMINILLLFCFGNAKLLSEEVYIYICDIYLYIHVCGKDTCTAFQ